MNLLLSRPWTLIFIAVTLFVLNQFPLYPQSEWESGSDWSSAYNSEDGNLNGNTDRINTGRIYTLKQIQRLRRAISPRYIRVLDWREYGRKESFLKKGILFTVEAYRADHVYIAGDFSDWKKIPMVKNERGVFFHIVEVGENPDGSPVRSYHYRFLVDGIWTHDESHNNRVDDGLGGYLSAFYLDDVDVNRQATVRVLEEEGAGEERVVEFAIYLPDVKNLSLVGSFNNWNPEHDLLVKGSDGLFRLRKRFIPGEYVYKFIADGRWILDKYNKETRWHTHLDEFVSYLKVD